MIYAACGLTLLIELLFFACTPYRRERYFMLLCGAVNVASNLNLNLLLPAHPAWWMILLGEGLVVTAEYMIYALACGRSGRLLLYTFLANLLSFSIGLVIFPLKCFSV